MNEARANRILAALKEQGVDQMLITDQCLSATLQAFPWLLSSVFMHCF